MGFGDYLMLSGKLREFKKALPFIKFTATRLEGNPFFEQMLLNNPHLTRALDVDETEPSVDFPGFGAGRRDEGNRKIIWDPELSPVRGDLFLTAAEVEWARVSLEKTICGDSKVKNRIIFISPVATASRELNGKHVTYPHAKNKEWPIEHWERLISSRPLDLFVMTGPPSYREAAPKGAIFVESGFRQACALLSLCNLYVGIEGGFHHAAAALGIPGIVIFGHWISPAVTGYNIHFNLTVWRPGFYGCGSLEPCVECDKWMTALRPEIVSNLLDHLSPPPPE